MARRRDKRAGGGDDGIERAVGEMMPVARALAGRQAARTGMDYDDLLSLAAEACWRAASRHEPGRAKPTTLAYVCVKNAMCDAAKRHARHGRLAEAAAFNKRTAEAPAADGECGRQIEAAEAAERLMAGLDETTRTMAWLHWAEGRTLAEIGELAGMSKQAVGRRMALAMATLRRAAAAAGWDH